MTMPASQPVEDMPGYVRHWIDNAWYWRPIAGPQDTWRDAILWLAKSLEAAQQLVTTTKPQNTHTPDAGKTVDYVALVQEVSRQLDEWRCGCPSTHWEDRVVPTLESLAANLTALREAWAGCGIQRDWYTCGVNWRCGACTDKYCEAKAALTHTTQGEDHA